MNVSIDIDPTSAESAAAAGVTDRVAGSPALAAEDRESRGA